MNQRTNDQSHQNPTLKHAHKNVTVLYNKCTHEQRPRRTRTTQRAKHKPQSQQRHEQTMAQANTNNTTNYITTKPHKCTTEQAMHQFK